MRSMPPERSGIPKIAPTPITITALMLAIAALTSARPIETGSNEEGVAKM